MTNLQFLSLLIPSVSSVVLVVLAWLNQNQRLSDLRTDMAQQFAGMDRQFDRVDKRLTLIEGDQKQFFKVTGTLEGRIEQLSR